MYLFIISYINYFSIQVYVVKVVLSIAQLSGQLSLTGTMFVYFANFFQFKLKKQHCLFILKM